ncbi:MAG: COG2078: Uncharacterized ACR [Olavius algarvensis Gamma 1 endosymbiont]|nr:MAG: COG2078: Uncharacterized ACR [Olavius algarvensis Gamma 1 endosymbiont]
MPSTDPDPFDPAQRRALLTLARQSITHGLDLGCPLPVVPSDYPAGLTAQRAVFVTLRIQGALRGCIGHLEATQSLVLDVAENAFAAAFRDPRFGPLTHPELPRLVIAAFRDPRFGPLTHPELPRLVIEVSVLTPAQALVFTSEEALLGMIEPGLDGLIFEDGAARGTFLPTVWEDLPDPRDFLRRLKQKAGLPPDHWSDRVRIRRYRTESFSE